MTDSPITDFKGPWFFLSNFFPSKVSWDGIKYPSVENAYQAAKTMDSDIRKAFVTITAGQAKRKGRTITLREDWELVKETVMHILLTKKFSDPHLKQRLIETGDRELIEGNNWGDKIWGCVWSDGKWVGENKLGKLLMEVRKSSSR